MPYILIIILDVLAILTALAASWLWYLAGRRPIRRVSRFEELNAADINRMVTAINRGGMLNKQAALASAASAACVALRFVASLLADL
jgi:hypothetical protein